MGDAQELQLHSLKGSQGLEDVEANQPKKTDTTDPPTVPSRQRTYKWWLRVFIYAVFLLAGQSAATLLGRLYFEKGGDGKWMSTLVRVIGFPIIIPLYILTKSTTPRTSYTIPTKNLHSILALTLLYVSLGIFQAAVCMFHSLGLLYLPVSTYSLICASQLGFNALFSFFLNSQKFNVFILNSLILLTISSILLVLQNESSGSDNGSKGKYTLGFICTVVGSAGYGLFLSLTQLSFIKVIKKQNLKVVLDMILYPTMVATLAVLVGLFGSGEWKGLKKEMDEFELGKVSYLMTLIWTAICWQVFSIGTTGLIFEVTSLFSNVISTFGLPILPLLAVFIFHDRFSGITAIAMVLAVWGFVSYLYQQYLDLGAPADSNTVASQVASKVSLVSRGI